MLHLLESEFNYTNLFKKKVPKGTKDNKKAKHAFLKDNFTLKNISANKIIKATNKAPCMLPMGRTYSGVLYKYFKGIAINNNSK